MRLAVLEEKIAKFDSFDLNGKTILIADDELTVRFYYQEAYNDTGARLILAKNGKEAVELYQNHPEIDLVLLDARMPEKSGIVATSEILVLNPKALIFIQSASTLQEDRDVALATGCLAYIGKPINPETLLEVIQKYIK